MGFSTRLQSVSPPIPQASRLDKRWSGGGIGVGVLLSRAGSTAVLAMEGILLMAWPRANGADAAPKMMVKRTALGIAMGRRMMGNIDLTQKKTESIRTPYLAPYCGDTLSWRLCNCTQITMALPPEYVCLNIFLQLLLQTRPNDLAAAGLAWCHNIQPCRSALCISCDSLTSPVFLLS